MRPTSPLAPALTSDPRTSDFTALFDEHYPAIHAYLRRRVGDAADDLAAETFVRALETRDRFAPERGNVRAWLFGIAGKLLHHHWRRERRQLRAYARTGVDPLDAPDYAGAADERLDAQRQARAIADALASLSARERDVLTLHAWAELSHAEIAAALGIKEGTVRSRLHRARTRMRERLDDIGKA